MYLLLIRNTAVESEGDAGQEARKGTCICVCVCLYVCVRARVQAVCRQKRENTEVQEVTATHNAAFQFSQFEPGNLQGLYLPSLLQLLP